MIIAATRSEISALPRYSTAYLTETYHPSKSGRQGAFVWRDGDYSSLISADPYQGVSIAHDTLPATEGAFIRDHDKGECHAEWWGCRFVYDSDQASLVQDDTARINSALAYIASPLSGPSVHFMFERGGELRLPRGFAYVEGQIVIPAGVFIVGSGTQSSGIVGNWPNSVMIGIWIGSTDQTASFSCGLRNLCIKDVQPRETVARNACVVYTESAQHTGGVKDVLIYSGGRRCFWAQTGYGGATYLTVENLETANFGASGLANGVQANPQVVLNYSTAMIDAKNLVCQGSSEPQYAGGSTAIGCVIVSGFVTLRNFHTEHVYTGVDIVMSSAYAHAKVENATGSAGVDTVCRIHSASASGIRTEFKDVRKNGSSMSLRDYRSGKPSFSGDITSAITA